MRRPICESAVGAGCRWASCLRAASRPCVDAHIDRRALGERAALGDGVLTEGRGERPGEPFGIVAAHMVGRAIERGACQARAFRLAQGRGRVALAGKQRGDRADIEPARLAQSAQHDRARRFRVHHMGGGGFAAKGVEDKSGDGGTVARAGEAVRLAPILEGFGGGLAARDEGFEDFNRGGDAGGGGHGGQSLNVEGGRGPLEQSAGQSQFGAQGPK